MTPGEARRADAAPLTELPTDMQERIAFAVAQPDPPPRWFAVGGGPDSPHPLAWLESRGWYEWHWQRGILPGDSRPPIPPDVRAAVIARDGHICQLCGGDIPLGDLHLDHIKPYSKGGPTTVANLQATHSLCNIKKGARFDA